MPAPLPDGGHALEDVAAARRVPAVARVHRRAQGEAGGLAVDVGHAADRHAQDGLARFLAHPEAQVGGLPREQPPGIATALALGRDGHRARATGPLDQEKRRPVVLLAPHVAPVLKAGVHRSAPPAPAADVDKRRVPALARLLLVEVRPPVGGQKHRRALEAVARPGVHPAVRPGLLVAAGHLHPRRHLVARAVVLAPSWRVAENPRDQAAEPAPRSRHRQEFASHRVGREMVDLQRLGESGAVRRHPTFREHRDVPRLLGGQVPRKREQQLRIGAVRGGQGGGEEGPPEGHEGSLRRPASVIPSSSAVPHAQTRKKASVNVNSVSSEGRCSALASRGKAK